MTRYVAKAPPSGGVRAASQTVYVSARAKDAIPQIRVQQPWYIKYMFLLVWIILLIIVGMTLNALVLFSTYRSWWNKNGGKKYHDFFSINLLAQYRHFTLGYKIWSLFTPMAAHIPSDGAAEFIIDMIARHALLSPDDDKDAYFMMPRQICETIVPTGAVLDPPPADTQYAYDDNNIPLDENAWRDRLIRWGLPKKPDGAYDADKWKADDNFLRNRYNIPQSSPFLMNFLHNESSDDSGIVRPAEAFKVAVGLNTVTGMLVDYTGGWWGVVKYGMATETGVSLGALTNFIFSIQKPMPVSGIDCSTTGQALGYTMAFVSGLAAVAGVAAFGVFSGGAAIAGGAAAAAEGPTALTYISTAFLGVGAALPGVLQTSLGCSKK